MLMITKETTIEELVGILPESVSYLMDKGIRVLICGEPIWGTIEEIVLGKGYTSGQLAEILEEINNIAESKNSSKEQ